MVSWLLSTFQALTPILTAGIGILALSLWFYTLAFNLRDRVALSFSLILAALVLVYGGESLGAVAPPQEAVPALLLSLLGVTFLPPAYLHFSDALLATTGRPSRGRRRLLVRLYYGLALVGVAALAAGKVVRLEWSPDPVPHLPGAEGAWAFGLFYTVGVGWALVNIWRAYRRTVMLTSRRRLLFIFFGALAPAVGSFPLLTLGVDWAAHHPLFFWWLATGTNILISALLVKLPVAICLGYLLLPGLVASLSGTAISIFLAVDTLFVFGFFYLLFINQPGLEKLVLKRISHAVFLTTSFSCYFSVEAFFMLMVISLS